MVLDRLTVKSSNRQRLTESVESALKLTKGIVKFLFLDPDEMVQFSEKMACSDCGISISELAPRDFSFNSPYGACPVCTGLGTRFEVAPDLVVPDETLTLAEGALAPWAGARFKYFERLIEGIATLGGFSVDTPWKKLKAKDRKLILYGVDKKAVPVQLLPQPIRGWRCAPTRRPTTGLSIGLSASATKPTVTGRANRLSSTCARWSAPPVTVSG